MVSSRKLAKLDKPAPSLRKSLFQHILSYLCAKDPVQQSLGSTAATVLFGGFFGVVLAGVWVGDKSWDLSTEAEALLWTTFAVAVAEVLLKVALWTGRLSVTQRPTLFKLSIYLSLVFTYIVYPLMTMAVGRVMRQHSTNSQAESDILAKRWTSLLIVFCLGIYVYYGEIRYSCSFPSKNYLAVILDHKMLALVYFAFLLQLMQTQILLRARYSSLHMSISAVMIVLLVLILSITLCRRAPSLFWSLPLTTLTQSLAWISVIFKICLEILPALPELAGSTQKDPFSRAVLSSLLLAPFITRIIYSRVQEQVKCDPFGKDLSDKRRLVGAHYLLLCLAATKDKHDTFGLSNDVMVYFDGIHHGKQNRTGNSAFDTEREQYTENSDINPSIAPDSSRTWLLLATRGCPSLVEVFCHLQRLKRDAGESDISAQLEYYNFRKLYETKLDALYKGTVAEGELESIAQIQRRDSAATSDLTWYFREQEDYLAMRQLIQKQIRERVDLYKYLASHPITNSRRIHLGNKNCMQIQRQIQRQMLRYLSHPEKHIAKVYAALIYYFGVVRHSKKTADDIAKVYKKKLETIIAAKTKLEYLMQSSKASSLPTGIELSALTEHTTVSLQVNLESSGYQPITNISANYATLLGAQEDGSSTYELSALLPAPFDVPHKQAVAGLFFAPADLDDTPNKHDQKGSCLEMLHSCHASAVGGTVLRTFDNRTITCDTAVRILPRLGDGITAVCRLAFGKRASEGLMLVDSHLNHLQSEPLVIELMQTLSTPKPSETYNISSFGPELSLVAKILQVLNKQNMRSLLTSDHFKQSQNERSGKIMKNHRKQDAPGKLEACLKRSKEISPFLFMRELLQTLWSRNREKNMTYTCGNWKFASSRLARLPARLIVCDMLGISVVKIFFDLSQTSAESRTEIPESRGLGEETTVKPTSRELGLVGSPGYSTKVATQTAGGESDMAEIVSLGPDHQVDKKKTSGKNVSWIDSNRSKSRSQAKRKDSSNSSLGMSSDFDLHKSVETDSPGKNKNSVDEVLKPIFSILELFQNLPQAKIEDLFSSELVPYVTSEMEMEFRILLSELQRLKSDYELLKGLTCNIPSLESRTKITRRDESGTQFPKLRSPSMEAKLHMKIPLVTRSENKSPNPDAQTGLYPNNPTKMIRKRQTNHHDSKILLSPKVDPMKLKLFMMRTNLGKVSRLLKSFVVDLTQRLPLFQGSSTQVTFSPNLAGAPAPRHQIIPMSTIESHVAEPPEKRALMPRSGMSPGKSPQSLRNLPQMATSGMSKMIRRFQLAQTTSLLAISLQPVNFLLDLLKRRNLSDLPEHPSNKNMRGEQRDTESVVDSIGSSVAKPIYVYFAALDQQIKGLMHFRQYLLVNLANLISILAIMSILFLLSFFTSNYIKANSAHFETISSLVRLNNAYGQVLWSSMTDTNLVYYWSLLGYVLSSGIAVDPRTLALFSALVRNQYTLMQTTLGIKDIRPFLTQRLNSSISRLMSSVEHFELNEQQINENSEGSTEDTLRSLSRTTPAEYRLQLKPAIVYDPISLQAFVRMTIIRAKRQAANTELMGQFFDNKPLPFLVTASFLMQRYIPALISQVGLIQNSFRGIITNIDKQIVFIQDEIQEQLPKAFQQKYNIGMVLFAIGLLLFLLSAWWVVSTTKKHLFKGIQIFSLLRSEDVRVSLGVFEQNLDEFKHCVDDEYTQILKYIISNSKKNHSQHSLQIMESKRESLNQLKPKLNKSGSSNMIQTKMALRKNIRIKENFKFDSVKSFLWSTLILLLVLLATFWASLSLESYLLHSLSVQQGYLDNYLKAAEVSKVYQAFNLYSTYGYFVKIEDKDPDTLISDEPIRNFQTFWVSKRTQFENDEISKSSNRDALNDLKEIIFGNICNQFGKRNYSWPANMTMTATNTTNTTTTKTNSTNLTNPLAKICNDYIPAKGGLIGIWGQLPSFMNNSIERMKIQSAASLNASKTSFSINVLQDNLITAEGIRLSNLHDFAVELLFDKYSEIITLSVSESSSFVQRTSNTLQLGSLVVVICLYILSCLRFYIILKRDSKASTEGYSNILPDIIFHNPYLYQVYKDQFIQAL